MEKSGRGEEESTRFGLRHFWHRKVNDAFESRGIRLPVRHHRGDEEQEQVQEDDEPIKNKSHPITTLTEILKQKTSKYDIDVEKIHPTLLDVFGEDSSSGGGDSGGPEYEKS